MIYTFHILSPNLHYPQLGYMGHSVSRTRWVLLGLSKRLTLFTKTHFFPSDKKKTPQTKQKNKKKSPVYRMRGQIYSQSGSRVIRLDAFLEWSFLSLLLSFFEVSPWLPPLPQHSSLLFILYKYNQTGTRPTVVYILCWFVLHTHVQQPTHTYITHTLQRRLVTTCGSHMTIISPLPKCRHILTHYNLITTWKEETLHIRFMFRTFKFKTVVWNPTAHESWRLRLPEAWFKDWVTALDCCHTRKRKIELNLLITSNY